MTGTIKYERHVGSHEGMPEYSSKTMGAEIELAEGKEVSIALSELKEQVDSALGLGQQVTSTATKKKTTTKKKTSKKTTKKKEAPVEVDENGEEWYDDSKKVEDSPVQEETIVDEEEISKPATKKKTAKKAAKKKTTRKKITAIVYDNTIDKHKKLIGDLTSDILGDDWRASSESKNKVRKVAKDMIGKDFIGKDGEVLDSFKTSYEEKLNS